VHERRVDGRVLRDAEPGDLPAVVRVYNESIPGRLATADTEPVSVASRQTWFAGHDPARRPLWVLVGGDGIDGWLSLQDYYLGRAAYDATAEVSVYVAAGRQGRGIGGILLDAVVHAAPTLRVETLLAVVFAHNEPSLRLFTRRGFDRWGLLPSIAVLDGVERSVAVLGRRLVPRVGDGADGAA
jgi:phosphinothricin acetyltransferase